MMPVFLLEKVVYLLSLLSINSILILTRPLVFLPFGGGVFFVWEPPFWPELATATDPSSTIVLWPIPIVDIVTSPTMGSCLRFRPATSADLLADVCWWCCWPGEPRPRLWWPVGLMPDWPLCPMCCWWCRTYESGPWPYMSTPSPAKAPCE